MWDLSFMISVCSLGSFSSANKLNGSISRTEGGDDSYWQSLFGDLSSRDAAWFKKKILFDEDADAPMHTFLPQIFRNLDQNQIFNHVNLGNIKKVFWYSGVKP